MHVHEPLAPSLSFTALRETRSPVVGTFHLTPVGAAAYELGQSVLERFFLRLDARIVTFANGKQMMEEIFSGDFETLPCGTAMACDSETRPIPVTTSDRFGLYVYRGDGRRSYRALLRALLAGFPPDIDRLVVALHRPSADRWLPRAVPRKLRSRIALYAFADPDELAPLYEGRCGHHPALSGGGVALRHRRRGGRLWLPGRGAGPPARPRACVW